MSLINKMLQDLDARGGDGARGDASSSMRPVSYAPRRGLPLATVGAAVVAFAVLGGGGYAAYQYFRGGEQPVSTSAAAPAEQAGRVQAAISDDAARKRDERIAAARQAAEAQAAASLENPENNAAVPESGPRTASGNGKQRADKDGPAAAAAAAAAAPARTPARNSSKSAPTQLTESEPIAGATSSAGKRAAAAAKDGGIAAGGAAGGGARSAAAAGRGAKGATAATAAAASDGGRVIGVGAGAEPALSSQQKAENEYRRALASLQDARVNDAIAGLEQAVYLYPRHEAARQTLVSLLIESGRPAEAMRHMTFATSLDPRQVNMAMLLARLQLEHGGNAAETLQRSLPYAESNADYRALVAGVLQRQNRHKEAADHYQAAVRLQPGNAVWWMGMGISLQADKRNAEAKIAFQRARDTGRLTPDLQTFVERRLQQLN